MGSNAESPSMSWCLMSLSWIYSSALGGNFREVIIPSQDGQIFAEHGQTGNSKWCGVYRWPHQHIHGIHREQVYLKRQYYNNWGHVECKINIFSKYIFVEQDLEMLTWGTYTLLSLCSCRLDCEVGGNNGLFLAIIPGIYFNFESYMYSICET